MGNMAEKIENAQRNCETLTIGKFTLEFRENERKSYGEPSDGRYDFYVYISFDDDFVECYSDDREEILEFANEFLKMQLAEPTPLYRAYHKNCGMLFDEQISITLNGKVQIHGDMLLQDINVSELKIMPYTGENDIDSVRIYNSDIIEFEYRGQTFKRKVFFQDACYYIELYPWNTYNPDRYRLGYIVENYTPKVIGNIYENPELLED